jgi:hypothetical protein
VKDAVVTPTCVGTVDGSILSQYHTDPQYAIIDQYNGYYRIASFSYSTSESQITVLQEQNSQLKVVGSVAVLAGDLLWLRFYKEKAFLVTTELVTPEWSGVYYNYHKSTTTMSLLNLTSPTNPSIIAVTEILTPWYHNMYPIEDGKYIISIDNSVSKDNASGITVYLFRATNNSLKQVGKPSEVIVSEVSEKNWYVSSVSSDAIHDAHAFRYLSQSRKLIIPVNVDDYSYYNETTDFQGFFVYDVDLAKGVKYVGNVTHDKAIYCSNFPSRSMVFKGDLITVMGSTIKRTSSVTTLSNLKWELENYCGYS